MNHSTELTPDPRYAPAPEKPREAYTDLLSACKSSRRDSSQELAEYLARKRDGTQSVLDQLARVGFRKFALLAAGGTGTVLETTAGQVIRLQSIIEDGDELPRRKIIEHLQPIHFGLDRNASFEVLPKLCTKLSEEQSEEIRGHTLKKYDDANHADPDKGDLGLLPDGTAVLVDKDATDTYKDGRRIPDELPFDPVRDAAYVVKSDQESIFPSLQGTGYISRQEYFFPALVDGRIRGVLSDDDIARLKNGEFAAVQEKAPECFHGITEENLSEFITLVKEEGWYPSQAQDIMRERGTLIEPDTQVSSATATEATRAKRALE